LVDPPPRLTDRGSTGRPSQMARRCAATIAGFAPRSYGSEPAPSRSSVGGDLTWRHALL